MSGVIFDLTGSYTAAFLNGLGWNLSTSRSAWLLMRRGGGAFRRGVKQVCDVTGLASNSNVRDREACCSTCFGASRVHHRKACAAKSSRVRSTC